MLNRFEHYQSPDYFGNGVGYEIVSAEAGSGRATARLTVHQNLLSPSGRIHGGAVATLLDMVLGGAAFTRVEKFDQVATLDLQIQYLKAIGEGEVLTAEAVVIQESGRFLRAEAKIYSGDDRTQAVAAGMAAFYIKRIKA